MKQWIVRSRAFAIVAAAVLCTASTGRSATLTPLPPGGSVTLDATNKFAALSDFGTQIAFLSSSITGTNGANSWTGNLISRVFKAAGDPFLTFVYQVVTTAATPSSFGPTQFSVNGFALFATAAGWVEIAGNPVATTVQRESDPPGDSLIFGFTPVPLNSGKVTDYYVIKTSADSYKLGTGEVDRTSGGAFFATGSILAPNPEPTTMVLAAIGFVPLASLIRSRRRKTDSNENPAIA